YTGLPPRGGLTFPDDMVLVPLERDQGSGPFARVRARSMAWEPQQHLTRGWLNARTPTQYVGLRATKSRHQLVVQPSSASTDCLVTNRLGVRIEHVYFRDAQGNLHSEGPLDADKSVKSLALGDDEAHVAALKMTEALRQSPLSYGATP